MFLIKTVVRLIIACKINEKSISMNEEQVILVYTKLKFETHLYMGPTTKRRSYLINQIIFYLWLDKK
jgi:hypothetical protein